MARAATTAATAHAAHPPVSVPVMAVYLKASTALAHPSLRAQAAPVAAVVVVVVVAVEIAAAAIGVAVAVAAVAALVVAVAAAVLLAIKAHPLSKQRAPSEPFFHLTPAETKWSADARPPGGSNGHGSRGQRWRPRAKGRR